MLDLRLALRLMARNWGFSLAVITILALCIGANTAVLSIVNAAMVRPLPYPQPERLMKVVTIYPHDAGGFGSSVDGLTWELVRDRVQALDVALYGGGFGSGINLGIKGQGILVQQGRVSAGFFRVLGATPLIGREFTAEEDRAGGPAAVILSHSLWRQRFGADPDIQGRRFCCAESRTPSSGSCPRVFPGSPKTVCGRRCGRHVAAKAKGRTTE